MTAARASQLWIGIDVGSTTVKVAVVDAASRKLLHAAYRRHNARLGEVVRAHLEEVHGMWPGAEFRVAFCGSAGQPYAEALGAFFVQEVIANTLAIKERHPDTQVAIELGGQDAKVVFFRREEGLGQNGSGSDGSGRLIASDMRMNGSCAGGTGAFVDQVAELLGIKAEGFEELAAQGKVLYDISGRCGVFAKTDIQPLLNQGASKADIALSSLHAIAKQTIGGLAQGLEIVPPVLFEGGPLTFIPTLVRVFQERLGLTDAQVLRPQGAETLVAYGAALGCGSLYGDRASGYLGAAALAELEQRVATSGMPAVASPKFFADADEVREFSERHGVEGSGAGAGSGSDELVPAGVGARAARVGAERILRVWLGLDAGSTTSKFVLLSDDPVSGAGAGAGSGSGSVGVGSVGGPGEVIYTFYAGNGGDPLGTVQRALLEMHAHYARQGVQLEILGAGSTGYGERLFHQGFHTDFHVVETVAHAEAAQREHPGVSFVLDIGGQDMKAINLHGGIVTGIVLNEACSAGCGSFIETYAKSLGIDVAEVAELAFAADSPSALGSRCTVFMNSSIITEQRNGRTKADILAGLCRSVVENVFTKVLRLSNLSVLGEVIVVQGGTFRNDAVLRAFEQYVGRPVIRPQHPGLMGAIGVALLTAKHLRATGVVSAKAVGGSSATGTDDSNAASSFLTRAELENFGFTQESGLVCSFCSNSCSRSLIRFEDGGSYVTGNRCERGELMGDPSDPLVREQLHEVQLRQKQVPNLFRLHNRLLFRTPTVARLAPERGLRIGFPRALESWHSLPFWRTLFHALGFETVVSAVSDYPLFEQGLATIPSDTACLPAKLMHGHVEDLIAKKVDRIFVPMQIARPPEHPDAGTAVCAMLQGYGMVVDKTMEPEPRHGIPVDHPAFHWQTEELKRSQLVRWFGEFWGVDSRTVLNAVEVADQAMAEYRAALRAEGDRVLAELPNDSDPAKFAVVIAGRPYHYDPLVSHHVETLFARMGIPVLTIESLPLESLRLDPVRMETNNSFHTKVLLAAQYVAAHPQLELVQLVSFSCGHDASLTDEMHRILRDRSGKEALVLKLDEGEVSGPLNIRVRSFVETVRLRRERIAAELRPPEAFPFRHVFDEQAKATRTILIPNLSPAFSQLITRFLQNDGYRTLQLSVADDHAVALGKKYVHNDICFPAQINIGEALAQLELEAIPRDQVAVGLAKNCENCRAGQYATLARKALDEAGYGDVPIVTTGSDSKGMHPAFSLRQPVRIRLVWGMAMVDTLEHMLRTTRPYEKVKGTTDALFRKQLDLLVDALGRDGHGEGLKVLREAVLAFNAVEVDRTVRRPRVGVLGEILVKYHPTANGNAERYLEEHGMEVVQPPMLDFFRRDELIKMEKVRRGFSSRPFMQMLMGGISEQIYKVAAFRVDQVRKGYRFYEPFPSTEELAQTIDGFIDRTYVVGEGWLIPAEILYEAAHGVHSFLIINPFGCMPNHISGRGMAKALKKRLPHIQILALDYDPDTSRANIENRLQMLVMNAKQAAGATASVS